MLVLGCAGIETRGPDDLELRAREELLPRKVGQTLRPPRPAHVVEALRLLPGLRVELHRRHSHGAPGLRTVGTGLRTLLIPPEVHRQVARLG